MTAKELNADVRKLRTNYLKLKDNNKLFGCDNKLYYEKMDEIGKELKRLYYADDKFEYCTKKSILTLYRMNLTLRVITLHTFGINIELKNL
jgi:hypothetical protein